MSKTEIRKLADEALDAFWEVVATRLPEAKTGDLSPDRTIRLLLAAEAAIQEWIANNVPRGAAVDWSNRDPAVSALLAYLDNNHVPLQEFGCYAALSEDKEAIFHCPMMTDGSPERSPFDRRHMNWSEVTAPEPEFVTKVNELFGTSFQWQRFAGR